METAERQNHAGEANPGGPGWTFLTNHAHVLLLIARDPERRMRDIAVDVGITERAVQRIVADLEGERYLERIRVGRRNTYRISGEKPLRHPVECHRTVSALIRLIEEDSGESATS